MMTSIEVITFRSKFFRQDDIVSFSIFSIKIFSFFTETHFSRLVKVFRLNSQIIKYSIIIAKNFMKYTSHLFLVIVNALWRRRLDIVDEINFQTLWPLDSTRENWQKTQIIWLLAQWSWVSWTIKHLNLVQSDTKNVLSNKVPSSVGDGPLWSP